MISHISIGASNLERSAQFYDMVLMTLGVARVMEEGGAIGYGRNGVPVFWINPTKDCRPSPGSHICFAAEDARTVDAFHAAGLAAGGQSNGPPGLRRHYHPDYYAAFLIDPDGHHIEAMTFVHQGA